MRKLQLLLVLIVAIPIITNAQTAKTKSALKIDFDKFTLPNGLQVIFHIDRSDPVVAVSLTAHVGSAREKPGRTGFAHLFEHLLFLESENLGKGGLDKMTARIGGSGANGSTNTDRTNYLQTVPNDALEKMLWAEADKLGWFINTVTDPVLAKEKQVVKNEKRQSYDNNPYGHTSYVIDKNLYPEGHPYNWQVIGSLEDLQNATLSDVKEFFKRWYVPNNVTLVVAGDFDTVQARKWVEKYFSEIKKGEAIPQLAKQPGVVKNTIKLYHEDNFARLPELTMAWPTVEEYHPDSYPLQILTQYLSEGKKAPLYKVLVEDKKVSSDVSMYNRDAEIAGQTQLSVRAFAGKKLDEVASGITQAFAKFEKDGMPEKDLARIKAGLETQFYNSLSSVLGKGSQLAQNNIFAGDPGYTEKQINATLAVTTADVMRVYNKYIKNKNYVATSFVPKGQLDLALTGSVKAEVAEESIVQGAEEKIDPSIKATYTRTPSSFDRSVEPPYGKAPVIKTPSVWNEKLTNGLQVYGIENKEVPLVQFDLVIEGGLLLENPNKVGVSSLMSKLLLQGTKKKTPVELEEAIEQLGARINISASTEDVRVNVNTLAKNYAATIALVQEILLEPRWDAKEFELLKESTISQIRQQEANPNAIAQNQYSQLIYGTENIRSKNTLGTVASVNAIVLDDLKLFYTMNISPAVARMDVVGALGQTEILKPLAALIINWKNVPVTIPATTVPKVPVKSQVYFYDVPNAKQSVIRFGYPALAATDKDYYAATVMNYILGGGGFASQLTQQLREGKGYTYGISSSFYGTNSVGAFTIASSVRANVTLESAQTVKDILQNYGKNYNEKDLETTKAFIIKSTAPTFETAASKLNLLENISKFGWKATYVKDREELVRNMTLDQVKALANKYLDVNKMIWLVVGDAATQLPRLTALGFGEPILVTK